MVQGEEVGRGDEKLSLSAGKPACLMPAPVSETCFIEAPLPESRKTESREKCERMATGDARITEVMVEKVAQNQKHRSEFSMCKPTISKYDLDQLSII